LRPSSPAASTRAWIRGRCEQFAKEFEEDLAAIAYAVKRYGLPANLKLSVHSGSDKFSIYKAIHDGAKKFNAGVHLKTAGTTWLEELIGLAEAAATAGDCQDIYSEALAHMDELTAPYATVIDIDESKLPTAEVVNGWTSEQYTSALRHDQKNPAYNSSSGNCCTWAQDRRQDGAALTWTRWRPMRRTVAKNVTANLWGTPHQAGVSGQ